MPHRGLALEFVRRQQELVAQLGRNGRTRVGEVEDDPGRQQTEAPGDGGGFWMHRGFDASGAAASAGAAGALFAGRVPARIGLATRQTKPPCRSSAGWPQLRERGCCPDASASLPRMVARVKRVGGRSTGLRAETCREDSLLPCSRYPGDCASLTGLLGSACLTAWKRVVVGYAGTARAIEQLTRSSGGGETWVWLA